MDSGNLKKMFFDFFFVCFEICSYRLFWIILEEYMATHVVLASRFTANEFHQTETTEKVLKNSKNVRKNGSRPK